MNDFMFLWVKLNTFQLYTIRLAFTGFLPIPTKMKILFNIAQSHNSKSLKTFFTEVKRKP
ncbi:MAG: hypothetical protein RBG13Loki_3425 [Promethearchaeota archaeon CR_4]|nr:MAG: hypothetical protein RBG13Loki_3425 [Candidatus Lokiarchaeota archaeon CR_4]